MCFSLSWTKAMSSFKCVLRCCTVLAVLITVAAQSLYNPADVSKWAPSFLPLDAQQIAWSVSGTWLFSIIYASDALLLFGDEQQPVHGWPTQPQRKFLAASNFTTVTSCQMLSNTGSVLRYWVLTGHLDGSILMWGGDANPRLWNATAINLTGHYAAISSLAISPTCRWLLSADVGGGLLLWGGDGPLGETVEGVYPSWTMPTVPVGWISGHVRALAGHTASIDHVQWSPGGEYAVTMVKEQNYLALWGGDEWPHNWNTVPVATINSVGVAGICWSPTPPENNNWLLISSSSGLSLWTAHWPWEWLEVAVWDGNFTDCAWHPNGTDAVAVRADGNVTYLGSNTDPTLWTVSSSPASQQLTSLMWSPKGDAMATQANQGIHLWQYRCTYVLDSAFAVSTAWNDTHMLALNGQTFTIWDVHDCDSFSFSTAIDVGMPSELLVYQDIQAISIKHRNDSVSLWRCDGAEAALLVEATYALASVTICTNAPYCLFNLKDGTSSTVTVMLTATDIFRMDLQQRLVVGVVCNNTYLMVDDGSFAVDAAHLIVTGNTSIITPTKQHDADRLMPANAVLRVAGGMKDSFIVENGSFADVWTMDCYIAQLGKIGVFSWNKTIEWKDTTSRAWLGDSDVSDALMFDSARFIRNNMALDGATTQIHSSGGIFHSQHLGNTMTVQLLGVGSAPKPLLQGSAALPADCNSSVISKMPSKTIAILHVCENSTRVEVARLPHVFTDGLTADEDHARLCPAGSVCASPSLTPTVCNLGDWCPSGSSEPLVCPPGFICSLAGQDDDMAPCPAGHACNGVVSACNASQLCLTGAAYPVTCPAQAYCAAPSTMHLCEATSYCAPGTATVPPTPFPVLGVIMCVVAVLIVACQCGTASGYRNYRKTHKMVANSKSATVVPVVEQLGPNEIDEDEHTDLKFLDATEPVQLDSHRICYGLVAQGVSIINVALLIASFTVAYFAGNSMLKTSCAAPSFLNASNVTASEYRSWWLIYGGCPLQCEFAAETSNNIAASPLALTASAALYCNTFMWPSLTQRAEELRNGVIWLLAAKEIIKSLVFLVFFFHPKGKQSRLLVFVSRNLVSVPLVFCVPRLWWLLAHRHTLLLDLFTHDLPIIIVTLVFWSHRGIVTQENIFAALSVCTVTAFVCIFLECEYFGGYIRQMVYGRGKNNSNNNAYTLDDVEQDHDIDKSAAEAIDVQPATVALDTPKQREGEESGQHSATHNYETVPITTAAPARHRKRSTARSHVVHVDETETPFGGDNVAVTIDFIPPVLPSNIAQKTNADNSAVKAAAPECLPNIESNTLDNVARVLMPDVSPKSAVNTDNAVMLDDEAETAAMHILNAGHRRQSTTKRARISAVHPLQPTSNDTGPQTGDNVASVSRVFRRKSDLSQAKSRPIPVITDVEDDTNEQGRHAADDNKHNGNEQPQTASVGVASDGVPSGGSTTPTPLAELPDAHTEAIPSFSQTEVKERQNIHEVHNIDNSVGGENNSSPAASDITAMQEVAHPHPVEQTANEILTAATNPASTELPVTSLTVGVADYIPPAAEDTTKEAPPQSPGNAQTQDYHTATEQASPHAATLENTSVEATSVAPFALHAPQIELTASASDVVDQRAPNITGNGDNNTAHVAEPVSTQDPSLVGAAMQDSNIPMAETTASTEQRSDVQVSTPPLHRDETLTLRNSEHNDHMTAAIQLPAALVEPSAVLHPSLDNSHNTVNANTQIPADNNPTVKLTPHESSNETSTVDDKQRLDGSDTPTTPVTIPSLATAALRPVSSHKNNRNTTSVRDSQDTITESTPLRPVTRSSTSVSLPAVMSERRAAVASVVTPTGPSFPATVSALPTLNSNKTRSASAGNTRQRKYGATTVGATTAAALDGSSTSDNNTSSFIESHRSSLEHIRVLSPGRDVLEGATGRTEASQRPWSTRYRRSSLEEVRESSRDAMEIAAVTGRTDASHRPGSTRYRRSSLEELRMNVRHGLADLPEDTQLS